MTLWRPGRDPHGLGRRASAPCICPDTGVSADPSESRVLRKEGILVSSSLAAFAYIRGGSGWGGVLGEPRSPCGWMWTGRPARARHPRGRRWESVDRPPVACWAGAGSQRPELRFRSAGAGSGGASGESGWAGAGRPAPRALEPRPEECGPPGNVGRAGQSIPPAGGRGPDRRQLTGRALRGQSPFLSHPLPLAVAKVPG